MSIKVQYSEEIIEVNIGDYCTEEMKLFGANNNLMRHLPDVRDSLKPGERRLLYTMLLLKLYPDANHKKVQSILGKTMDLHPHGDAPLHGTITGLGQSWNNTVTLVDGYGNYGSEGGADPSAPRYIEGRLSKFAVKCFFDDFNSDVVDMKMAYDGKTPEPEYLPSRYPISLINSHFGIGYGTYCSIPPYNFREVIDLTLELMENPNTQNILIYPDIPTKADIIDDGQFLEACETGDGKFRMRGKAEFVESENMIRISSVPFQVSSKDIVANLVELIDTGKINGIKDIKNRSGKKNGVCIDILLKKEADPVTIIHTIYKKTDVQKSFSIDFTFVNDYEEVHYNIRTLLLEWIDFRRSIKRRHWSHMVRRHMERKHILETIIFVLEGDNLSVTTDIFKTSEDIKEISRRLMVAFPENVSSLQADKIAAMRGYEMTIGAKRKYEEELNDLVTDKIPLASKIAKSSKKIDAIIKQELMEGVKLFGSDRLSTVINIEGERMFRNTKHLLIFTKEGNVKKLPDNIDTIGDMGTTDYPIRVIHCENIDSFFIFDETGNVSKVKVVDIPNTDLTSGGVDLKQFCPINGDIVEIIKKPDDDNFDRLTSNHELYFFMISQNGIVKKTSMQSFMNMNKNLLGMILKDGDRLQTVKILMDAKDILLYTTSGYGIKFNSDDIKETSRMSMGVKTVATLQERIVGADIIKDDEPEMIMITAKGNVKKSIMDTFNTGDRTSKLVRLITLNEDDELFTIKTIKGDEQFTVYLKNEIFTLNCGEFTPMPRLSKGKKVIPVRKGEEIMNVRLNKD